MRMAWRDSRKSRSRLLLFISSIILGIAVLVAIYSLGNNLNSEVEKRQLWIEVFEDELKELHQNGFVHRDLKRPSGLEGLSFDNILLTTGGLRLIDVGISALKSQVSNKIFGKYIETELEEIKEFRKYFLNR